MKEKEFREFMSRKSYFDRRGVEHCYTEKSINKRISSLYRIEDRLSIDIDDYMDCSAKAKSLLFRIQRENLEKPYEHQPLQNAIRRYYEFVNGEKLI